MKKAEKVIVLLTAVLLCSCDADLSVSPKSDGSDNTFIEESVQRFEELTER